MKDCWQLGVVVEDIDAAQDDLARAYGLTWTSMERAIDVDHEGTRKEITLRYAISQQGPIHIELIEGQENTPWWPPHGVDHVAMWDADLAGRAAVYEEAGYTRQVSYATDDGKPLGFTYHRSPNGFRVETVDAARREGMMSWLRGGDYPGVSA